VEITLSEAATADSVAVEFTDFLVIGSDLVAFQH
jgi:hypothetical protein